MEDIDILGLKLQRCFMDITVVYLGGSRVESGCSSEVLNINHPAPTLQTVIDEIKERHPKLIARLQTVRWAINFEFSNLETELQPNDEIALIPPVQGGNHRTLLTNNPIPPQAFVPRATEEHGATAFFVGTVRNHNQGNTVSRLVYEAYMPMAAQQLEKIAASLETKYPKSQVSIWHRIGELSVGEVSVVIQVNTPHRDDAFKASREAIEQIKVDVPIWKREESPDGETWLGWGGG